MTFTNSDPFAVYPSTSARNHPFEGPEVFDDIVTADSLDPWPTVTAATRALIAARASR